MAQNPDDFSAYDAEDPLVGRQRSTALSAYRGTLPADSLAVRGAALPAIFGGAISSALGRRGRRYAIPKAGNRLAIIALDRESASRKEGLICQV